MAVPNSRTFHEEVGRERQPRRTTQGNSGTVYTIALIAALGGLLFGYDTGVISGAILFLKNDFVLSSFTQELAVSAVLIGTIIGAAIAGRMADRLGRRMTLIIMGIIFAVGAILTALSPNLAFFLVFRIIVGIGIGVSSLIAPMYIAEMAPPAIRGKLVTFNQLAITAGIAVSYWIDLAFASGGMGWRPMMAVAAIPGIALLVGMLFLSESPRWLAGHNKWDEADKALSYLPTQEKDNELRAIRASMNDTQKASLSDLFRSGLTLALVAAVGLALFQQFVGINTVIYYAPTIFGYAGFKSASGAILATSVVGVVNFLVTLFAVFLLDRVGRRPLLIGGIVGMTISLIAMGVIFLIGPTNAGWLILIALLVYIASFAIGMGPVFWLMSSEIFPTRFRGTGGSIATVANWGGNLLISITFLSLISVIGKPTTFWLYALLAIAAFIFCWFLIPETKGRKLEDIEAFWKNGRRW